jgi:hypothetical protein
MNETIKILIRFLIAIAICFFVVMGFLRFMAHITGIYTKINVSRDEVRDMQRFFREFRSKYDRLNPEDMREYEKLRLDYEIKALNAFEPFVTALDDNNQMGY